MSKEKSKDKDDLNAGSSSGANADSEFTDSPLHFHKGSLKIAAACADAERYLIDIDLLHDGCKVINRWYIHKLCKCFHLVPPVSYYKAARSAYLEVINTGKSVANLSDP